VVARYLSLVTLEEALDLIRQSFPPRIISARIPLEESSGHITASAMTAQYSIPEMHLSAMDGIAVRSADTVGADEQHPVTLPVALRVNTGNLVPPEFDAVIMIEDIWEEDGRFIIRKPASPWQHVRPAGEDIGESEMVLPSFHRIRPHELGALAAYGVTSVPVVSASIGLIPTGSELVAHGLRPAPGQVVESNTVMADAWLGAMGATCRRYPITRDEPDLIREAVQRGIRENDIVVISAGSSAGTRDYTAQVISELGEVLIHGVGIKPGKPVIIGQINKKPVIGMPGYPLSALTVLREIITPLLGQYGLTRLPDEEQIAFLTRTLHSDVGTDEFVLLSLGRIQDRWVASPQSRGAGVQMSAVRANAYLRIPASREGYEAGEQVRVHLMVPGEQAQSALLITGSHDPALDELSDLAMKRQVELHSTHVGSMGGLMALMKGECHAAPMHLLAPDGSYNTAYLAEYLPGEELTLVCIAEREQGIVSRTGLTFEEISGHQFINRQKGSGTRMLLDHELRKRRISHFSIPGYEREVTTHLAVALAVRTGEADAGMCVASAAKALSLPFVPVAKERYELVIRTGLTADPRIAALLDTIESPGFSSALVTRGGYDVKETGRRRQLPQ
jgi:molybdenum cofactor synthesis domain-containing protein